MTMNTSIHQEADFPVSGARLYDVLLGEREFSEITGAPAQIERGAGGAFSLFGGRVTGRNVELVPDQRIIQAWLVAAWPTGVYSIVRFDLTVKGMLLRVVL